MTIAKLFLITFRCCLFLSHDWLYEKKYRMAVSLGKKEEIRWQTRKCKTCSEFQSQNMTPSETGSLNFFQNPWWDTDLEENFTDQPTLTE